MLFHNYIFMKIRDVPIGIFRFYFLRTKLILQISCDPRNIVHIYSALIGASIFIMQLFFQHFIGTILLLSWLQEHYHSWMKNS